MCPKITPKPLKLSGNVTLLAMHEPTLAIMICKSAPHASRDVTSRNITPCNYAKLLCTSCNHVTRTKALSPR